MRNKDKNKEKEASEFLRYSRSEMTDRERNAFERELQRDPFATEAAEGFTETSSPGAGEDLIELRSRLKKRIRGRKKIMYYRIAASIAVLMILSSVFLILNKDRVPSSVKNEIELPPQFEIAESEPLTEPAKRSEPEKNLKENADAGKAAKSQQHVIEGAKPNAPITAAVPTSSEGLSRQSKPLLAVKGKVISSEDNLPLPGATVLIRGTTTGVVTDTGGNFNLPVMEQKNLMLVASYIGMETKEFRAETGSEMKVLMDPDELSLDEVVVVGYGASVNSEEESGYLPPLPLNGKTLFNKYIEENLVKPSTMVKGQRAVVVLSFTVEVSGKISNLKVIRSPGEEYSDEAIRLIRSGPEWKPSVQDGVTSESETRVRIVFK